MPQAPLKALLVDSWYDAYLGVMVLVRVHRRRADQGPDHPHDGHGREIRGRTRRRSHARRWWPWMSLGPGEIGFFTGSIKEVADTRVGDTITEDKTPDGQHALPGFKPAQPVVFCGLFPVDAADFEDLRAAMGKLRLNDASFSFEMEIVRRARLRLPLRLPRPAAPRNHPGAARARIRPRPDRDSAFGRLQAVQLTDGTEQRAAQPGRHARRGEDRRNPRAVDQAQRSSPPTIISAAS